jgi:hypothetical protein
VIIISAGEGLMPIRFCKRLSVLVLALAFLKALKRSALAPTRVLDTLPFKNW